ncbi:MAG: SGNH/GDSL hydrolase family protein [Clostridia bacterium]|nr:SGNH/GDSL hydrolase family protein [Clostridia bacterium]
MEKIKVFTKIRAAALFMAACMLSLPLISCTGDVGDASSSTESTTAPDVSETAESSDAQTDSQITSAPVSTGAVTTEAPAVTDAPTDGGFSFEAEWKLGYVGSSTHSSYKNTLNTSGGMYSYSSIIRIPYAGTTVSFTDDNTNSNGDSAYASAAAYVFSSWKQENGTWVIDLGGYNASGSTADFTDNGGSRTYTYTTVKDGECLRLGYRSGQSTSFTPSAFPVINIKGKANAEKVDEDSAPAGGFEYDKNATVSSAAWHSGHVGSDQNQFGYTNVINDGAGAYAYTDVIELGPRGTKAVFVDPHMGSTSNNAYCVSSWKKDGGSWVFYADGANFAGIPEAIVSAKSSIGSVYTYISTLDGECIRFCYRSDGAEKTSSAPKIYISSTDEKGTLEQINSMYSDLNEWISSDKSRSYFEALEAQKVLFIGDSYFAGNGLDQNYVWPALLGKKYGLSFLNAGVNGSMISNYVSGHNPMVERYKSLPAGEYDIIVLEGGKNDYNQNVPIGQNNSTSTKDFCGALRAVITGLQSKYPGAMIICVTPWEIGSATNGIGNTVSAYGNAMIKLCGEMGVPCINAMDPASGVLMTDARFRVKYCMTPSDISHLNAKGHQLAFPYFEEKIAGAYTEFKK